jgi:hypothetical protein
MPQAFNIQYLQHNEINKTKWNKCIDEASNGLIYGYSFYLDRMAKQWHALVLNKYEAVMPLTWNKKYNIHYLYQPFLCAQLGVFGKNIDGQLLSFFLKAIPEKFKYWDVCLNHKNVFSLTDFHLYERSNYVLNLKTSYDQLYSAYRENIKRNIKKAEKLKCYSQKDIDSQKVINLASEQMKSFSKQEKEGLKNFKELFQFLHQRKQAITYGIFSSKKELLSSCVFFFSHQRAYYILVGNHPKGRTIGASHALIDAFIKDHAGKNLLLDFEGSDIRNLALFYSSFGAIEEKYAALQLNKLPFYLKWMKK